MSEEEQVKIRKLKTGVPGFDEVLGGGLPEFSFNLVAGDPGSGKTTLVQQMIFTLADDQNKALYFTVLGEPAFKMLRYQQQMTFFQRQKVGKSIHFISLSDDLLEGGLKRVFERIQCEVDRVKPRFVVVDSFRTVSRYTDNNDSATFHLQDFVQQLAIYLTSWLATTFLIGEYMESNMGDNPIFTVADGIIWLSQSREHNSVIRKMQIVKMRGQQPMPGLHTFRITNDGIQVFPRILQIENNARRRSQTSRLSTGIPCLDEMMCGGIPSGDSVLVSGPTGSGKTIMATRFIAEGIAHGERGVILVFEEYPDDYLARAKNLGNDLQAMIDAGNLRIIYLRPLDLSVDEALHELRSQVVQTGATRVVIDSLSGFEVALAQSFSEYFRESIYRLVASLVATGVTIMMTEEVAGSLTELSVSPHQVSFLSDDAILLSRTEIDGRVTNAITVVKMRGSAHSNELRTFEITDKGIVIGQVLDHHQAVPEKWRVEPAKSYPGLNGLETVVLQSLQDRGESTNEELSEATGITTETVATALARIVSLNYAVRTGDESNYTYRPLGQSGS